MIEMAKLSKLWGTVLLLVAFVDAKSAIGFIALLLTSIYFFMKK